MKRMLLPSPSPSPLSLPFSNKPNLRRDLTSSAIESIYRCAQPKKLGSSTASRPTPPRPNLTTQPRRRQPIQKLCLASSNPLHVQPDLRHTRNHDGTI